VVGRGGPRRGPGSVGERVVPDLVERRAVHQQRRHRRPDHRR
jgi:hypothetical protein